MTHSWPIRVYYEDVDLAGIVYYANYLRFIERARSEMVREAGIDQVAMREAGTVFAVAKVEADYLRPARYDDRLDVLTETVSAGPVRLVMDQEVRRGEELLFRARVKVVCMDLDGRPKRLPEAVRNLASTEP
ncbi:tol-pal system-associated acyl-CoA thioesterase [Jannaschia aquimarina]|uniref:YbgC_2 protein n=1 Tax=Jannaschia aquimarina TaxID=935700 RepID=A0A0D1ECC8_9RHOB|nr:tol-pal system-associated acyl-CoA thioesterase [Jannaschia aquimarina]KIT14581.1 Acyl-CoA thioester hydrolase YbgC [Jannaschia aquimarina]SNT34916.1 acyl-CoA thioester hydrolase [Jannaschia aquimarina]